MAVMATLKFCLKNDFIYKYLLALYKYQVILLVNNTFKYHQKFKHTIRINGYNHDNGMVQFK